MVHWGFSKDGGQEDGNGNPKNENSLSMALEIYEEFVVASVSFLLFFMVSIPCYNF